MRHRDCALGLCPPIKNIFGVNYGVCPLVVQCPDDAACGYAMACYNRLKSRDEAPPVTNGHQGGEA